MIKFIGEREGRSFLGIVLTDENIERLKKDQPVHFTCEQLNLPTFQVKEVVIMHSPTEKEFVEKMRERGYNPKVQIDPLDTKQ